ncbi:RNA polymerase sigma-70 factor [Pedobacter caeni]|uniref:RNA polymerase sigma-70 factor n=1 Tax=Pedobacter caeni TaxID=288992 RepID=UPI0011611796|nr:RNA polymerase sigma-70 factor [Pedobacter caeni]
MSYYIVGRITQAGKMDHYSFESTYNLYWEELYGYCLHHCKDNYRAEGIVQDVFLSLWERNYPLELDTEGSIKSYLYKAIKNKVFDFYREQAKKNALLQELRLGLCDETCLTENEVFFNDLNLNLGKAIDSLPCRCREVYQLSRERGLNNKEIALHLSISEKTVEQHMTKALRFIRKKIESLS